MSCSIHPIHSTLTAWSNLLVEATRYGLRTPRRVGPPQFRHVTVLRRWGFYAGMCAVKHWSAVVAIAALSLLAEVAGARHLPGASSPAGMAVYSNSYGAKILLGSGGLIINGDKILLRDCSNDDFICRTNDSNISIVIPRYCVDTLKYLEYDWRVGDNITSLNTVEPHFSMPFMADRRFKNFGVLYQTYHGIKAIFFDDQKTGSVGDYKKWSNLPSSTQDRYLYWMSSGNPAFNCQRQKPRVAANAKNPSR